MAVEISVTIRVLEMPLVHWVKTPRISRVPVMARARTGSARAVIQGEATTSSSIGCPEWLNSGEPEEGIEELSDVGDGAEDAMEEPVVRGVGVDPVLDRC